MGRLPRVLPTFLFCALLPCVPSIAQQPEAGGNTDGQTQPQPKPEPDPKQEKADLDKYVAEGEAPEIADGDKGLQDIYDSVDKVKDGRPEDMSAKEFSRQVGDLHKALEQRYGQEYADKFIDGLGLQGTMRTADGTSVEAGAVSPEPKTDKPPSAPTQPGETQVPTNGAETKKDTFASADVPAPDKDAPQPKPSPLEDAVNRAVEAMKPVVDKLAPKADPRVARIVLEEAAKLAKTEKDFNNLAAIATAIGIKESGLNHFKPGAVPAGGSLEQNAEGRPYTQEELKQLVLKNSESTARGTMQLLRGTAKGLGVDPLSPRENVQGGIRLIQKNIEITGSLHRGAAAYYGGDDQDSYADHIVSMTNRLRKALD
ncbi:MAG: transglycosylase SLT domain-containing protein [Elusimicrobiota bacterium]